MAEFCLDCWNELNETNDSPRKYVFSRELELCEGCGEYKHVIVCMKRYYYLRAMDILLIPFKILILPVLMIYKIIEHLWKKHKNKHKKNRSALRFLPKFILHSHFYSTLPRFKNEK